MQKESGRDQWVIFGVNPVLERLKSAAATVSEVLVLPDRRGGARTVEMAVRALNVPLRLTTRAELSRLSGGGRHQGVAARVSPYQLFDFDQLLAELPALLLFLDGITDPQNLGAILRSAEALGAGGVVLPANRSASVSPIVFRSSAGALEHLKVSRVVNLARALDEAKKNGYWVVGLEPEGDRLLTAVSGLARAVLVVGGEGRGLRKGVKKRCDFLARIQMRGRLGSVNAGVAAAVGLFWLGLTRSSKRNAVDTRPGGTVVGSC